MRLLSPGLPANVASSVKSVQQCYMKLVLPYECQLKGMDLPECIQCFKSAARYYAVKMGEANRIKNAAAAASGAAGEARESFDAAEKMNGDAMSDQAEIHRRLSQRTSSQDSDTSGYHGEGHELTHTVSHNPPRSGGQQQRKQEGYDFAEGTSQGSVEDEPLPDIGVQETESLLGMQYLPPVQGAAGPGTPGGQNTPSPSPYTPQYQSAPRGDWAGADMVPNADVSELGMIPGHPPPAYPPSYSMDPASLYRMSPHPGMMMSGYSPYGMPPPQVVPNDYSMMRGGYPGSGGGGPYQGMMPLGLPPGMDPTSSYSQHYMMSQQQQQQQQQQMAMYRHSMEMGYPGHAIPPEWQQQWRHHNRVTSIPPHMQAQYQRSVQPSTSPRPLHAQSSSAQPSASVAQQQQQQQLGSSPHPPDATRMHWQDQQNQGQGKGALVKPSGSSSPKPKLETSSSGAKGPPTKSVEMQAAAIDSMRRPLPDWSGCVEGTKPQLVKRRRLFSGDCGKVGGGGEREKGGRARCCG